MSRKVSQETFDEVVRENIEDFDLDEKGALEDAIKQFKKQNVDLSSIDISGGVGRDEILNAIKALDACTKGSTDDDAVVSSIAAATAPIAVPQIPMKWMRFSTSNGAVMKIVRGQRF